MVHISEYMMRKALMKTEGFIKVYDEIKNKIDSFNHFVNSIQIEYSFIIEFKMILFNKTREKYEENVINCGVVADDTILIYGKLKKETFASLVAQHFLSTINSEEIQDNQKITKLNANTATYSCILKNICAWSNDYVGIYHIEQECGEGWIILPKEPCTDIKGFYDCKNQ